MCPTRSNCMRHQWLMRPTALVAMVCIAGALLADDRAAAPTPLPAKSVEPPIKSAGVVQLPVRIADAVTAGEFDLARDVHGFVAGKVVVVFTTPRAARNSLAEKSVTLLDHSGKAVATGKLNQDG